MKESRKIFDKGGLSLYLLIVIFSLVKEFVLVPVMSNIWKLTLLSTPDGFISNANIKVTLIKSPWVLLVGIVLIGAYLFFTMWQVCATIHGIAYVYEDEKVRVIDLIKVSANDIVHGFRPKNAVLLFYTAIILPLTNLFQASEMVGAFVMPEYIQDFIDSKIILLVLRAVIALIALYFALRWLYLLPSFFLKKPDFKLSSKESFEFTKKKNLKNIFWITVYGFIESLRLFVAPFIIIYAISYLAYFAVSKKPLASDVFSVLVLNRVNDMVASICSTMVYLSTMCFIVHGYYKNCEDNGTVSDISLEVFDKKPKRQISGRIVRVAVSLLSGLLIGAVYLFVVIGAQYSPDILDQYIKEPLIVAHKGYSSKAPENTMYAFELADETKNADFIELDVWSSKDGIPVVIHNETITDATSVEGKVYDYTYEELTKIPASYKMDIEDFPDARIPSLEEVIKTYSKTTPILIEIKGYHKDEKLPEKIVALMEKYDCTETSMIHSGNYEALKAVKQCNPDIKCGLIQAVVTGNCYDLPYADFISVEHTFVTEQMVDKLHERGKEIFVWTVNNEDSVDKMKDFEIDGLITDYPDTISEQVKLDESIISEIKATINNGNYKITLDVERDEDDY